MPYPNEHSCRLRPPSGYQRFRRMKRGKLHIILGIRSAKQSEAQAYRYPTSDWTEAEARAHCQRAKGTFEPAKKD